MVARYSGGNSIWGAVFVFYSNWKRTRTKRLPDGDHKAHTEYSEYQENLKHVITLGKF